MGRTKEQSKEYNRRYYAKHREKLNARALEWYRQNKGTIDPAARRDYMRAYYAANPDKWLRTPAQNAARNAQRRARYAADVELRERARAQTKKYWHANPLRREAQRLKKYGLTPAEKRSLLERQGHRCAICGESRTDRPKLFPVIDHCHATGAVRGILCAKCNKGLGLFRDNPDLLRQAALYLTTGRRG